MTMTILNRHLLLLLLPLSLSLDLDYNSGMFMSQKVPPPRLMPLVAVVFVVASTSLGCVAKDVVALEVVEQQHCQRPARPILSWSMYGRNGRQSEGASRRVAQLEGKGYIGL